MHHFAPFESEEGKQLAEEMREAMSIDSKKFEILSTIRYDPMLTVVHGKENGHLSSHEKPQVNPSDRNLFLLRYHWERLKFSIAFFQWSIDIPYCHLLEELLSTIEGLDQTKPYKLRVLVSQDRTMRIEAVEVAPRSDLLSGIHNSIPLGPDNPQYSIYLDKQPTLVSAFTSFKTTQRDVYTRARQRGLPQDMMGPSEVLLYNTRNMITEGSITNVAFHRRGRWLTPPITSGCLCGVVRNHLLVEGLVEEDNIELESVNSGEKVLLFNAIIGVCCGVIMPN